MKMKRIVNIRLAGRVHASGGIISLTLQSRALWAKTGGGERMQSVVLAVCSHA